MNDPVVVVGGGVAGLGAAWALHREGVRVHLLEAGAEVGGVVNSRAGWEADAPSEPPGPGRSGAGPRDLEGLPLEFGPQTLSTRDPELLRAFRELGLDHRMVEADAAGGRRYVVHAGQPVAVPHGPADFLTSPLLSASAKFRLLGEPFRGRSGPSAAGGGDDAALDESVASFVRRRFGPEVLDRLVDPFVSGVFAGDPERLALGAVFPDLVRAEASHGSVVRGMLSRARATRRERSGVPRTPSRILTFRGGLQSWPLAVAEALGPGAVRRGARVVALAPEPGDRGGWRVTWEDAEAGAPSGVRQEIRARAVVLATPAPASARLLRELDPEGAEALAGIPYAPVSVVHVVWPRASVAHPVDGFGVLVPSLEGRRILGSLWPGTLFPGRVPEDLVVTANFVGGARTPERAHLPDPELLAMVRGELGDLLGARGEPVLERVRRWPEAIPQYVAGHSRRVDAISRAEERLPGLVLAGNWRSGVSLGAAWTSGTEAGARVGAAAEARRG
jgi:protoporphyrinogen/coproporphyrinogen III oxidase